MARNDSWLVSPQSVDRETPVAYILTHNSQNRTSGANLMAYAGPWTQITYSSLIVAIVSC